jgi:predicted nucleotidyltransferase
MKTDLDHLPPQKQREIERVVQLIFEEFDDALALAKHEWKKAGRILKVILYGSYARGTYVDEPHTAKGYQSDYDLLIIVNDKRLADRVKYWSRLDDRLMREYPCSPYLLHGGVEGWVVFLGLWAPWPIAFLNWRWARRQRNFWDGERSREAERRKARHNANMLDHK